MNINEYKTSQTLKELIEIQIHWKIKSKFIGKFKKK